MARHLVGLLVKCQFKKNFSLLLIFCKFKAVALSFCMPKWVSTSTPITFLGSIKTGFCTLPLCTYGLAAVSRTGITQHKSLFIKYENRYRARMDMDGGMCVVAYYYLLSYNTRCPKTYSTLVFADT